MEAISARCRGAQAQAHPRRPKLRVLIPNPPVDDDDWEQSPGLAREAPSIAECSRAGLRPAASAPQCPAAAAARLEAAWAPEWAERSGASGAGLNYDEESDEASDEASDDEWDDESDSEQESVACGRPLSKLPRSQCIRAHRPFLELLYGASWHEMQDIAGEPSAGSRPITDDYLRGLDDSQYGRGRASGGESSAGSCSSAGGGQEEGAASPVGVCRPGRPSSVYRMCTLPVHASQQFRYQHKGFFPPTASSEMPRTQSCKNDARTLSVAPPKPRIVEAPVRASRSMILCRPLHRGPLCRDSAKHLSNESPSPLLVGGGVVVRRTPRHLFESPGMVGLA